MLEFDLAPYWPYAKALGCAALLATAWGLWLRYQVRRLLTAT